MEQTQTLIYCRRSNGLDIRVEQAGQLRWLLINGQRQSQIDLTEPSRAIYPYVQQIIDDLTRWPRQNILQIGLGTGELNRCILTRFNKTSLTTIEREPAIVDIYKEFFQLADTCARDQLLIGDPPPHPRHSFDCVIVDIYPWPRPVTPLLSGLIPLIQADGVLLLNLPHPEFTEELTHWCQQHFQQLDIAKSSGYQNQLFKCSNLRLEHQ